MTNKRSQLPLTLLGLILGYSNKLKPALAHANHSDSASPEPKAADLEKVSQPLNETSDDATETLESQSNPIEPNTTIEETLTSAEVSAPTVSTAKLTDEFSFGLGESIFGLMIATPFLLLSLKKLRR